MAASSDITPIFLLSLPRSGSTLVQRILAAHEGVATASEPWLLLPWLAPLQPRISGPDPWHTAIHEALVDFTAVLPDGQDAYRRAVHDGALRLYAQVGGPKARFFLDKTPPYSLIIDEIARTFPDGRLVFLWRNPLSVVASVIDTFAAGRWRPNDYPSSLFAGAARLVDGYRRLAGRAFGVRYEDLVMESPEAWTALCEHCGFAFAPDALRQFTGVTLDGRMGDPNASRFDRLSPASAEKWKAVISSPVRRDWCRRYLRWLGSERLATMGYDLDALMAELDAIPARGGSLRADVVDSAGSLVRAAVKARLGGDGGTRAAWRAVLGA